MNWFWKIWWPFKNWFQHKWIWKLLILLIVLAGYGVLRLLKEHKIPDFEPNTPMVGRGDLPFFLQKPPPKPRKLMGKAKFYILTVSGCIIASLILIHYLRDFVVWFIDAKNLWWAGEFYF